MEFVVTESSCFEAGVSLVGLFLVPESCSVSTKEGRTENFKTRDSAGNGVAADDSVE
jgi:hypothetical protein